MQIGAHVSIAGGLENAPINAHLAGCECFQMFSRSPQGGKSPQLTPSVVKKFKANCKKYKLANYYIHTPYYINLASINNRIKYGSIKVIREELERGSILGAKYVMSHLGSAKDVDAKKGVNMVIDSLKKVLAGYNGSTKFLIEMSAGAGAIIGDSFEEIKTIIKGVGPKITGVCFDTAHAFASGYDLRTQKALNQTLREFDKVLGPDKLKLIHINDSASALNSHIDRHEHIGIGKIGREGFIALLKHPQLKNLDVILETPADGPSARVAIRGRERVGRGRQDDIKVLKKLRLK